MIPLAVDEKCDRADEAVTVRVLEAGRSLLRLGREGTEAATVLAIAIPKPFKVPVAAALVLLLLLRGALVAIRTEPTSESISAHISLMVSECTKLEIELEVDIVSEVEVEGKFEISFPSNDQGAGLICFILGPKKDCIRNRDALLGPISSSSSAVGLERYERLDSVDDRFTCLEGEVESEEEDLMEGTAV